MESASRKKGIVSYLLMQKSVKLFQAKRHWIDNKSCVTSFYCPYFTGTKHLENQVDVLKTQWKDAFHFSLLLMEISALQKSTSLLTHW